MTNLTLMRLEEESVLLTSKMLTQFRAELQDVPAVMINCDGTPEGINGLWIDIATKAGFIPIRSPSDFLQDAKNKQIKEVFSQDGAHLSQVGNLGFGEILGNALIQEHIFSK